MALPPTLKGHVSETRRGRSDSAAGYAFVETTYEVVVNDDALNLHHGTVAVSGPGGRVLVSAPWRWRRMPFLWAIPERVYLEGQPGASCCVAPTVTSLTRVLSAPPGVVAEVRPPRELTVRLTVDAPPIAGGVITVATTAGDQSPLEVRVTHDGPPRLAEGRH